MEDARVAQAHRRLAAARTRLVLERPFVGTLTLHLRLEPADPAWCATLGTDAERLWFEPGFVLRVPFAALQFWIAHVALHCALGHFARRRHRLRRRWDVACDHAVNLLLRDDGLTPPPDALANRAYAGLSAEQIYPLVPEDTTEAPFDRHAAGEDEPGDDLRAFLGEQGRGARDPGGRSVAAQGESGSAASDASDGWDDAGDEGRQHAPAGSRDHPAGRPSTADLAQQWQTRFAAAAQAAREAGRLGTSWQRVLETLLEPPLPWRALLARHVFTAAREDFTFQRPPRREGTAILPRLSRGSMRLVAVLDTSGSITARELAEFAGEIDALKSQVRAEVTVHACDERLAPEGPWVFDPWETVALPSTLAGGGGTRFAPVFEWVERAALAPDLLIYFTDAQGEFPETPPPYPVLWLVKGRGEVPFGERVQLA